MNELRVNNHPVAKLPSVTVQAATLQPIHGKYPLGHTRLADVSVALPLAAVHAIKTSKPSDVLSVVTEDGTELRLIAWGQDLEIGTALGHLAPMSASPA